MKSCSRCRQRYDTVKIRAIKGSRVEILPKQNTTRPFIARIGGVNDCTQKGGSHHCKPPLWEDVMRFFSHVFLFVFSHTFFVLPYAAHAFPVLAHR